MASSARVYTIPATVTSQLHQLGLNQSDLHADLQFGLLYALDVRPNDARGHAGTLMYFMVNRSLGEALEREGWTRDHTNNFASMVHPTGSHAVSVAAGNRDTGNPDREPTTKRDRGPATQSVIATNAQMDMFSEYDVPRLVRPLSAPRLHTWMLLHYIDHVKEEIRAEISLPLGMTDDKHVNSWQSRIILEPIPFVNTAIPVDEDHADDDINQSAYTSEVTRKVT